MAFLKFARAAVVKPHVTRETWSKIRTARTDATPMSASIVEQASEVLGKPFNPSNYLLTHCTIVASCDVEKVPNVKLGSILDGGVTVNRKYADYRITKDSEKYINHNYDAFPREALLKSYKTFVGAHNFIEHVQLEEHSKGRIIDAVARDIGDSIYIDILVATDRKHTDLIEAIESGEMSTLSMGCSIDTSTCTKCGNVATDDTTLCRCVKYEKGNTFYDDQGTPRIVAETCGHSSLEPNAGITFIEASWVKTPAFTGAVMRNILEPAKITRKAARAIESVLSTPPKPWVATDGKIKKTARFAANDWDIGGGDSEPAAEGGGEGSAAPAKSPLDALEESVYQSILDKVKGKIEAELSAEKAVSGPTPEQSTAAPNDNIVKQAYSRKLALLLKNSKDSLDFIIRLAAYNERLGIRLPTSTYRIAAVVGVPRKKETLVGFVQRCNKAASHVLSIKELKQIVRIAKLLSIKKTVL